MLEQLAIFSYSLIHLSLKKSEVNRLCAYLLKALTSFVTALESGRYFCPFFIYDIYASLSLIQLVVYNIRKSEYIIKHKINQCQYFFYFGRLISLGRVQRTKV